MIKVGDHRGSLPPQTTTSTYIVGSSRKYIYLLLRICSGLETREKSPTTFIDGTPVVGGLLQWTG